MPARKPLPPHPIDAWLADDPRLADPRTKAGRTQRVVLRQYLVHQQEGTLPTTCRFLFYELEQQGNARKPSRTGQRREEGWPPGETDVIDAATRLRDVGLIPWEGIADETRSLDDWGWGADILDALLAWLPATRINPWGDEPPPVLLCESRGIQGALRSLAQRFVCPISGTAGMVAGMIHREVAPLFRGADAGRWVLYLGDLDPQGLDIERNTRRVLEKAAGLAFDEATWTRLALTEAQVAAAGMEPVMKVDRRRADGLAREAWEVEALGQRAVFDLVEAEIAALLPAPLADVQAREQAQRAALEAYLDDFPGFDA